MPDFSQHQPGLDSPPANAFVVTPNDSIDLANDVRALYVGTSGDIKVDLVQSGTVTLKAVSGLLPIRVRRVYATGTTATDIVGLY